ncbi:MAG: helix-turn-helix transcriptional regulator [Planctomycetes bacterium]|nr:helix-turn-helix transcriptional regulator [Planctomycetota bacterium]
MNRHKKNSSGTEGGPLLSRMDAQLEAQRLELIAANSIEKAMEAARMSRADVARAVGVEKSRVTKVLDGETNMTLKTLAAFGLACDVRWELLGIHASRPSTVVVWPDYLPIVFVPNTLEDLATTPSVEAEACVVTKLLREQLAMLESTATPGGDRGEEPIGPLLCVPANPWVP